MPDPPPVKTDKTESNGIQILYLVIWASILIGIVIKYS